MISTKRPLMLSLVLLFVACSSRHESHVQPSVPDPSPPPSANSETLDEAETRPVSDPDPLVEGEGDVGPNAGDELDAGAAEADARLTWQRVRPPLGVPRRWRGTERFESCARSCLSPLLFEDEDALRQAIRFCFDREEDTARRHASFVMFTDRQTQADDSVRRSRCRVEFGQLAEGWAVTALGEQDECWPDRTGGRPTGFSSELCP
ncbi:MAG: hypothetical protein KC492_21390 [Myxococcales bacterium]|nr:hypothetical protein [Myxococcales bacterium]